MSFESKRFGKQGEEKAAEFFRDNGFTILDKNFRYGRYGEIDLVISRGNLIAFVEVKTRTSDHFGGPLYSLTQKKINAIKKTAQSFLLKNPHLSKPEIICRFDLLAIEDGKISWHEDAFR